MPANDVFVQRGAPGAGLGPAAFAAELARGLGLRWATYFYCGTWSWALLPVWWYVPFCVASALFLVGEGVGWFRAARRDKQPSSYRATATLLLLVPLLAALLARHEGVAHGGGHYLHAMWPFTALLIGGALVQLRRTWLRALLAAALIGCFMAYRVGDVAQLLITGGIAGKAQSGFIHVPAGTGLSSIGTALANLGELAPIAPGLVFYALGVAAQAAVVVLVVRCLFRGSLTAA